ncbi:TolB family protein [Bacillus dakarensis]|uniref:TolB family protein n=1 Tax=Robertmurraya dakarensis TaxID=1926278 RepID=UPI00098097D8|nr:PD40 domain-containing protein [Bacillus dakarensis]
MKKKYLVLLLIFLLVITIALVLIGLRFNKTENEKQNGLSNQYDVSPENTIAYVAYEEGKPQLFLHDGKEAAAAVEYDDNTLILDPTFKEDGTILAYITTNKDKETELISTVHFLDLSTKEVSQVFTDASTITEIEFNPKGESLLFLRAGTYENYSPITGKRPHDFDVYEYDLTDQSLEQKTNLSQYSIHSLHVSADGERVFLQRDDDSSVETAEDSFNVKQRIFEIPIEKPEQMSVISDPDREVDVFSFTITPSEEEIIFQSISNPDDGGTFKYELYKYNLTTKTETQLTHFGEYVGDPVISADGQTVYFMLDKKFAKGDPEYHLYRMSISGDQVKEISLQ